MSERRRERKRQNAIAAYQDFMRSGQDHEDAIKSLKRFYRPCCHIVESIHSPFLAEINA